MNFYSFHIGDYISHTRHLNLMEDLAYRRILDLYYQKERPLPLEPGEVSRLIGMPDQENAVSNVLSDFFLKSDNGYTNKRCDEEISVYQAKANRAKQANMSRWNGKKSESDLKSDMTSDVILDMTSDAFRIPTNNHKPITINQEVKEKEQKEKAATQPPGFVEFWKIYPKAMAKKQCLEMWKKRNFEAIAETILDDVRRKSKTEAWTKENGMYVPMSRTYLNQERWDDKQQEPQRKARGLVT